MFPRNRFPTVMLWTIIATLVLSNCAMAYIGPGSGMEYFAYALGLIVMMSAAFLSLLMWPFYVVLRWIRGRKAPATADQTTATTSGAESNLNSPPSPPADSGQTATSSPSVP
jgi:hypothetical protein